MPLPETCNVRLEQGESRGRPSDIDSLIPSTQHSAALNCRNRVTGFKDIVDILSSLPTLPRYSYHNGARRFHTAPELQAPTTQDRPSLPVISRCSSEVEGDTLVDPINPASLAHTTPGVRRTVPKHSAELQNTILMPLSAASTPCLLLATGRNRPFSPWTMAYVAFSAHDQYTLARLSVECANWPSFDSQIARQVATSPRLGKCTARDSSAHTLKQIHYTACWTW